MSKSYRTWQIDQPQLLPPSVHDFVPKDHLSRFVVGLVTDGLDLRDIHASYQSELGQPPFHPTMMMALLLYAYAVGVYSSRRIAKACRERTDFMMIVALDPPDFRTVSDFRKRHLKALAGLFVQVLQVAQMAGLVKLGHVALDGTKLKANASKHKAMSYERMKKREAELKAEVEGWLAAAEAADAEEDKVYGRDRRGDELPAWVADKEKRLAKIAEAKAALEAEAKAAAQEKADAEREAEAKRQGRTKPGRKTPPPSDAPDGKAQRNFTDSDSRVLKTKDGYIQGYSAQAAVDAETQVIVAQGLTNSMSDQGQLEPMTDAVAANLGVWPDELSADAGYCSEANLAALAARGIAGYVATGRAKHPAAAKRGVGGPLTRAMRTKLKRGGWRSRYRLRKQTAEPVFGQIKEARGFRQFLLRGIEKVRAEWAMVCTGHNIQKLAGAWDAA